MPAAALVDVARAFTPRFEQIGSVVLLDASGLSRLFGSAQELGEHLREALIHPNAPSPRVGDPGLGTWRGAGDRDQCHQGNEESHGCGL